MVPIFREIKHNIIYIIKQFKRMAILVGLPENNMCISSGWFLVEFSSPRLMHIPENAVLGRGSFGTVWRARDAHTGRCYAATWCSVFWCES